MPEFLPFLTIVFLFGLMVGSFLNVVIMRGARSERLAGRSHCDSCGKILAWYELIPIVSFLYQKGRCLHCGAVFSVQYPLVELGTGVGFTAAAWYVLNYAQWTSTVFFSIIIGGVFIAIAATIVIFVADMAYQIIPNGAVLVLTLLGFFMVALRNGFVCLQNGFCASSSSIGALNDIAASAGFTLFLFALWFFSHGKAMGFGDVKLIGATSLVLGFPASLIAFLFSFWLGGIAGIILLLACRSTLTSKIPFGPFILLGSVLAFFLSDIALSVAGFSYFF